VSARAAGRLRGAGPRVEAAPAGSDATAAVREPRRELVAEAYERLRRLIVEGRLVPGTRLVEVELAQRLEMSRTPVRTALYLLHQEGYVEASGEGRQSRLTVAPLTQDDAVEVFGIVGEVEGLAACRAAGLDDAPRAALVARLRALNTAMARAATRQPPDPAETIRLDMEFHRAYVESGAGRRLSAFFHAVKPHADRFIYLYYTTLTTEILVSTREHEVIVDAIAAGDPARARRAVQHNWENAAARLSKSIAALGERGVW
jgi:DNA-binding GntR family transcriptional regulator